MEHAVHRRRRGRVPDRRSRHLGAPLARLRAARVERAGLRRSGEARDAPVDRRGRHEDLLGRRRAGRGNHPQPARSCRRRGAGRPSHRRRRHASLLELDGPGHLAGRALPEHRRGAAAAGALTADLRPARPRGRARFVVDDRSDERGAVFPAAPAGAVHELAVLDGPRHRPEVVPHDRVPALSAHRHSRPLSVVERIRELRQHAHRAALHRQRQEDLVGSAAAADLRHARVPDLRRADGAARLDCDRRARAGHHRQALSASRSAISASAGTIAR